MKLNLMGAICHTGYGVATKNFSKCLHQSGVDLHVSPYGNAIPETQEEIELFTELIHKPFHYDAPCLNIWHQYSLDKKIGRGKYFAMPIFELDRFNEKELYHLKYPDELIVNSTWAQEVIKEQTGRDSYVVPLGTDSNIFHKVEKKQGPYTFFIGGKWEIRKAHDIIAECFARAFPNQKDVKLIVACHNPFLTRNEIEEWENKFCGLNVEFAGPFQTQLELAAKMAIADCGIFVSRAEGWDLPCLDMMSMGKPIIASFCTAHTEYCNDDNSFLLHFKDFEDAYDGKWFHGQGRWVSYGENEKDQLIEIMRYCKENNITENLAGEQTADKFSWENSTKKLIEVIYE